MLYTADKETGTFIDCVDTIDHGNEMIVAYEKQDREDGIYTPDFYTIVDENHCEV